MTAPGGVKVTDPNVSWISTYVDAKWLTKLSLTGLSMGLTGVSISETGFELNTGGAKIAIKGMQKKDAPIVMNNVLNVLNVSVTQISMRSTTIIM